MNELIETGSASGHVLTLANRGVELILVGGGHPYLWLGRKGECIGTAGVDAMRALANAILAELDR